MSTNNQGPLDEREEVKEVNRWTLALDSNGDIKMNERNTFATIDDDHAVLQDLKVAIATRQGEDPLDPGFGLDVFAATRSLGALRREIRQTLEYDDFDHSRVKHVSDIDIRYDSGARDAEVVATLVLDRGQELQLLFQLGGQSRLAIRGSV